MKNITLFFNSFRQKHLCFFWSFFCFIFRLIEWKIDRWTFELCALGKWLNLERNLATENETLFSTPSILRSVFFLCFQLNSDKRSTFNSIDNKILENYFILRLVCILCCSWPQRITDKTSSLMSFVRYFRYKKKILIKMTKINDVFHRSIFIALYFFKIKPDGAAWQSSRSCLFCFRCEIVRFSDENKF